MYRCQDTQIFKECKECCPHGLSYMDASNSCVTSYRILPLDLTESDLLPSKVEQATEAFGHIDILILAAGILQFGYFKDIPPEVDRRVMEVNYFGQRMLIQAVLPGEMHVAVMS